MSIIEGQNFARQNITANGDTFIECNVSQADPHTALSAIDCIFIRCNLVNCDLDPSNTVEDCNTSQGEIE